MKRTKEWWARLTKEERAYLVWLERGNNRCVSAGAYVPCDVQECRACGDLIHMYGGYCVECQKAWDYLIAKANGGVQK